MFPLVSAWMWFASRAMGLEPTKARVLKAHAAIAEKPETLVRSVLQQTTGRPFYNLSRLDFVRLLCRSTGKLGYGA